MKKEILAGVLLAVLTAAATDFTWTGGGSGGWNDPANYEGGAAIPQAGDTVFIPSGTAAVPMTVTVTDDDAALVSSLAVVEVATHDRVVFDVSTNTTLNCAVRLPTTSSSYSADSCLVKVGAGDLFCASYGKAYSGSYTIDYRIHFDIREGSVSFAGNPGTDKRIYGLVGVKVGAGAVWRLGGGVYYNVGSLTGDGEVTNAYETSSIQVLKVDGTFAGTMGGEIEFYACSAGVTTTLTGTNSTFALFQTYSTGTAQVKTFGKAGEPSSIGTNSFFKSAADGGRFVYLGDGEETDKELRFTHSYEPVTLDAGAVGGLTFAGRIGAPVSAASFRRFAFDGSNSVESVFSGAFYDSPKTSTYITKKGSGTWHLTHHASRSNAGVVAVEDGTLRFDTIAEAGKICSLGTSALLRQDQYVLLSQETGDAWVPYAFLLGGATTEGTFEYAGTDNASCTSRLIAVTGPARIRNGSAADFYWSGICGWGDGEKTLTLDGDSTTADNRIDTLTNACGVLSLVKEGAGTWTLGGEQAVNGTVDVRAGTLVVRREPCYPTYFRLTVKRNLNYWLYGQGLVGSNNNADNRQVLLQEFALYDADGIRCNRGLEYVTDITEVTDLKAGQVMKARGGTDTSGREPSKLFDDVFTGIGWHGTTANITGSLNPSASNGWLQLVMRLPENSPVVTAYDYSCYFGTYTKANKQTVTADVNRNQQLGMYVIEGSADGSSWYEITNVTVEAEQDYPNIWHSDNSTATANQVRKGLGYPIDTRCIDERTGLRRSPAQHVFDSVTSVSVAAGATLKAESEDGVPVVIRGLTVDPLGAGTLDGFAFAENGTVNVEDAKAIKSGKPVKMTILHAADVENVASWDFTVGGKADARYSMSFDPESGTFRFHKPGAMILVR